MAAFFYHIIILELYICFPIFFLYSLLYLLKNWHLDYNMIILFQIVTEEILLQGLTLKSRERTQIISFYMCNLFVAVFMTAFFYHIIILELYICFPLFFLYSLLYPLKNWHLDHNMIILFQIVTEEILLHLVSPWKVVSWHKLYHLLCVICLWHTLWLPFLFLII